MSTVINEGWIVSRRDDALFFIGSAALGYALLALAAPFGFLPLPILMLWVTFIDGPHLFSTATRALFDPHERRRIGALWLLLIPLCLIGPLVILAFGQTVTFLIVAAVLGHYHITKQHMGFVFLYKRKAQEREDYKLDRYFTVGSHMLPLLYFVTVATTGRKDLLPAFLIVAGGLIGFYAQHQLRKSKRNTPKLLLLAAFIPLSWLSFIYAAIDPSSPGRLLAAVAMSNAGHAVQYLRLMWFHNHNRYQSADGVLGTLSRKWLYFFAAVVLLAIPAQIAKLSGDLVASIVLGFVILHYLIDARIWRVRGDHELAKALRL